MVNVFPILFLAPLAHTVLRIVAGLLLAKLALRHVHHAKELAPRLHFPFFPFPNFLALWLALTELVIAFMYIAGFYTQIAALIAMVYCIKFIVLYRKVQGPHIPSKMFFVLLFAVSLSLFITGAGAFAFDLPI